MIYDKQLYVDMLMNYLNNFLTYLIPGNAFMKIIIELNFRDME